MAHRVISAGHICIDVTPGIPDSAAGKLPGEILIPGKLLNVNAATVIPGGAAYTTGLAMQRLGSRVSVLGKIGRDAFGGMIKEALAGSGAGGLIETGEAATSYSIVLAVPGVDRCFLHHPGANDTFTSADIPDAALEGAELFHFGYPPLMRSMYLDGGEELARMFRRVKARGVATSLDMAAVDPLSEAGRAPWEAILRKVLPDVDFFLPSFEELCYMLDRPRWEELTGGGGDPMETLDLIREAAPLAERCLEMGCGCAVVKCGVAGLYYEAAGADRIRAVGPSVRPDPAVWAGAKGVQPCFRVKNVVSAVGAGDVSIAAWLTALLEGRTPAECTRLAAAEGAVSVTSFDTLGAILPLDRLDGPEFRALCAGEK